MERRDIAASIRALNKSIDESMLREFIERMPQDYFTQCAPEDIAQHVRMATGIHAERPISVTLLPQADGTSTVTVVAFDYFGALSIITGLLTSFGFAVLSGHVHTLMNEDPTRGGQRGVRLRTRIVDVLQVRYEGRCPLDDTLQQTMQDELVRVFRLLEVNRVYEARAAVNRRLAEALSARTHQPLDLLAPVHVTVGNSQSEQWTVLNIRSRDSFGFLYAFSNALSLRGLYIHGMLIRSDGTDIDDSFYLTTRQGAKLVPGEAFEELKQAAILIKRFTQYLPWAPDPAKAVAHFDRFLDKVMEGGVTDDRTVTFLSQKASLDFLARLFGTSDFLWDDLLRMRFDALLPVLEDFRRTGRMRSKETLRRELREWLTHGRTFDDKRKILNEWKDREMFRIDVRHVMEPQGVLARFSNALSNLAEVLLDQTAHFCMEALIASHGPPLLRNGHPCPFTMCGLGKFGGRELGYASDLELMFVYGGAGTTTEPHAADNAELFHRLAESIIDFIESKPEGVFHIDTRLRPFGHAGALATPLDQFRAYYRPGGEAEPFERQALIKLRWVAGDRELGRAVEDYRDQFVYSGEAWDLTTALHLRDRQKRELVEPGTFNVKLSAGGLIDIEYAVQYLQILHGHAHSELRTPSTQAALEALGRLGIISRDEEQRVRAAYIFFRALSDALRIVRGNAKDLVLPERGPEAYTFLARRLGHLESHWEQAAERLEHEIERHRTIARMFFANRFQPNAHPLTVNGAQ